MRCRCWDHFTRFLRYGQDFLQFINVFLRSKCLTHRQTSFIDCVNNPLATPPSFVNKTTGNKKIYTKLQWSAFHFCSVSNRIYFLRSRSQNSKDIQVSMKLWRWHHKPLFSCFARKGYMISEFKIMIALASYTSLSNLPFFFCAHRISIKKNKTLQQSWTNVWMWLENGMTTIVWSEVVIKKRAWKWSFRTGMWMGEPVVGFSIG